MKIEINIDEDKLQELVLEMIVRQILSDRSTYENREARFGIRDGVDKAIKEYIYAKKDKIIESVIERASLEIVKKGLPKLLDKLKGDLE